jgi:hypothetical protein
MASEAQLSGWALRWAAVGVVSRAVFYVLMAVPLVVVLSVIWPGVQIRSVGFVFLMAVPFAVSLWRDRRFLCLRRPRRLLCMQVQHSGLPTRDDEVNRIAVQRLQRMADWHIPRIVVTITLNAVSVVGVVALCVVATARSGAVYLLCAIPILVGVSADMATPAPEPARTRLYRLQDALRAARLSRPTSTAKPPIPT